MSQELEEWLAGRTSLCVVSPHFDDVIYSAFVALTLPALKRRAVATMITTAPVGKVTYWATYTGFADTHVEHLERAREDLLVLGELGVEPVHLGGVSDSTESLPAAVDRFAEHFLGNPGEWAFLLPAGAGIPVGRVERLVRRVFNRPVGQMAHPEHLGTRDRLRRRMRDVPGALWGYYGENPYVAFDGMKGLQTRLERVHGARLHCVRCNPQPEAKLHSAEGYASQAKVALGPTLDERLGFASRPEVYFL